METRGSVLLDLLNCAIHGGQPHGVVLSAEHWDLLLQDCMAHGIFAIVFPAVERLLPPYRPPEEVIRKWRKSVFAAVSRQLRNREAFILLYRELADAGIDALVFKGLVLAALYPEAGLRISGDGDLYLRASDLSHAQQVLERGGYLRRESPHESFVLDYYRGDLHIELHRTLFEEGDGVCQKFLPLFPQQNLWENSLTGPDGLRTFGVFDHLCYLVCHMAKHFICAGFGLRHLADLTLFTACHTTAIPWEAFWTKMDAVGLTKFAGGLFSLCMDFLGLPETAVPLPHGKDSPKACAPLLDDILDAGVFGVRTQQRQQMRSLTARITHKPASPAVLVLRAAFPGVRYLKYQYPYLARAPWLLPAAWLQRACRFTVRTLKKDPAPLRMAAFSGQRLALLREYGLIE